MEERTVESYAFFKNYYVALKELLENDSKELNWKINQYIFDGVEPSFTDDEREQKLVWLGIVGNLNNSIKKSEAKSPGKSRKKS